MAGGWRVAGTSVVDLAIAATLAVAAGVTAAQHPWSVRTALDVVASLATAGTVALRRREPLVASIGFSGGLLVLAVVGQGGTTTWAFVALLVMAFSTTEQLAVREATYATVLLMVATVAYGWSRDGTSSVSDVLSPLLLVGLPAAAGALLHRSRAQSHALADLAAELAAERDRAHDAAVIAERARVARELHDVIAHTVGVMVVQAGAAERLLPPDHAAYPSVHAIRQTGKEALGELRRVIGLLRSVGEESARPQPGLAELDGLLDAARTQGPIDADIDTGIELTAGAALTVYRTVQEAVTNTRRHAPRAKVTVGVHAHDGQVVVEVSDEGRPVAGDPVPATSSGYGLLGLAERAELYGGTFAAGPRSVGPGWLVRLTLPLPPVSPAFAEGAAAEAAS